MKSLLWSMALAAVTPAVLVAQSSAEIVESMLAAYEESVASVENYLVVQEVMGVESEMYFEKEIVDGRPVFQLRSSAAGGFTNQMDEDFGYGDVYAVGPALADHSRYGGTEMVDGARTHVLVLDDLRALDLVPEAGPEGSEFQPRTGRILVDAERWFPRRMEFTGDLDTGTGPVEVTTIIDLRDYRETQGLLMPFLTVVRMDGLRDALDPAMLEELEQMRRQLEALPEDQRAMMEQMFGSQLEQMESMLGSEDGAMTVEMRVLEVTVNGGPPR